MTVTTESVRSALEMDTPADGRVESHLHPAGSYDVADHAVPTGREEIWRFTPLKRLRGLHADAEFMSSATSCTWTTPDGVRVEGVSAERPGRLAAFPAPGRTPCWTLGSMAGWPATLSCSWPPYSGAPTR